MELRHLKYFVTVAEELHFGRAAERLHISQPPLSQQIRQLEEELGAPLFKRTSRKVELTHEGEAFYQDALDILDRADLAVEHVQAVARGESGRLRVSFIGPAARSALPRLIREYKEQVPDVILELTIGASHEQLRKLRMGSIDAGFIRLFNQELDGLDYKMFSNDPYILVMPEGHHLTRFDRVPLSELVGEKMVFYPGKCQPGVHDRIMDTLTRLGGLPNIVQEVNSQDGKLAFVRCGMGVALVPAFTRNETRSGLVYRDIDGDLPSWDLIMVWRKGDVSPALKRFMAVVDKYVEEGDAMFSSDVSVPATE